MTDISILMSCRRENIYTNTLSVILWI
ncbi:hypothetical protein KL86PLE_90463 [uncultured Pleomorphomonas sp.]|uniref:Uncharacterized protein n=1 Tax=uncultured Pleomorphomonas sp. TaxID=442121 RepID=A0A212LQ21_9HYPH|nr:hypothetical protein KL86PLE_90463 [uncultured Pleomorphomonas sp.]